MSPGNAAAPGVGTEGERENIQQGRADTPSLPMSPEQREGAQRRSRIRKEWERTRASRKLDAIMAVECEVRPPSTYGLAPDQRRAYAAELLATGWQPWEIRVRLASPEVAA